MILPLIRFVFFFKYFLVSAKITWGIQTLKLFIAELSDKVLLKCILKSVVNVEYFVCFRVGDIDYLVDAAEY